MMRRIWGSSSTTRMRAALKFFSLHWQTEPECCLISSTAEGQRAFMRTRNSECNAQAETRPRHLGSHRRTSPESIEDVILLIFGDAGTVIRNIYDHHVVTFAHSDVQRCARM